ncbi:hypothetical protein PENARI_c004G02561 [Penicillium arizonense]|uniref:Uncharacterized protein n=1 Tax=Penicillium arizonense TaxID=1835702 RepID=A0A1F5LQW0_PENAI|nr:hypothetical protein PENARI_c004G02561 [Penicillium arizonense]OGE55507.1 hypothetical protein PENARI_c004G02561 [Penicillium arizonense]
MDFLSSVGPEILRSKSTEKSTIVAFKHTNETEILLSVNRHGSLRMSFFQPKTNKIGGLIPFGQMPSSEGPYTFAIKDPNALRLLYEENENPQPGIMTVRKAATKLHLYLLDTIKDIYILPELIDIDTEQAVMEKAVLEKLFNDWRCAIRAVHAKHDIQYVLFDIHLMARTSACHVGHLVQLMSTVFTLKSKGRFYARVVVSAHVRPSASSHGFTDHHLEYVVVDSDCVKTGAKGIKTKGVDPKDLKLGVKTETAIEREQSMSLEG